MRTSLSCLFTSLFWLGCSGSNGGSGGGTGGGAGGGGGGGDTGELFFNVTGTAKVHPVAVEFLADAGTTASIVGLTVRVEEPYKVAIADPSGVFSTQTLDAGGAFAATHISTGDLVLGVAAGISDPSDAGSPRVIRSATVLFDDALEGGKPTQDITGTAFAVPVSFHDQLTAAVGEARIHALNKGSDAGTLVEAGFILGRVVDAQGKPVAGVTVAPVPATLQKAFFYPAADLSSVGAATSSNGLFLYVHTGGDVLQFSFTVTNQPTYKKRNSGATHDACLVVDVYPGTTAP